MTTTSDESFNYMFLGTNTVWSGPVTSPTWTWYVQPRTVESRRKRSFALPVAIGHAVFFLALALAGWLR